MVGSRYNDDDSTLFSSMLKVVSHSFIFFCHPFTEAKYHYVVERTPLREGSDAWKRAQESGLTIPKEMAEWVNDKSAPASNSGKELESVKA
jgi:hypothetical protein